MSSAAKPSSPRASPPDPPDPPDSPNPPDPTGSKGAGRRRRLSEQERRSQIISATVATVADLGYNGASLERIAATAELSKGLLSHYFGDKETLMTQTARITLDAVRNGIAATLDLSVPVPDVIRQSIHRVAAVHTTYRAELTALDQIITHLRDADGHPILGLGDYESTYLEQEKLFRRGQQEGSLRAFDTRVMAVTYQGALDAMLGYLRQHPEIDPDTYAHVVADLIIAAVQSRPDS
ncbi:TetR/AcrR family transcriptional regulator [Nakamurella lactea]|uniref:TetR/AcrR family transcriptional regulator n=1 Tax=Nakamurella lactea TaxID=459515 RepID=UPI000490ECB8|nr:TetR/AcrR family transcriptional regulator [Nakamurella lactea]